MDSTTLNRLCKFKCFLGVFPCDQLPTNVHRPSCLIVNSDRLGEKGEHWMAIFVNKEGYGDFFCSYGSKPNVRFTKFMNEHCYDWNYNAKRIQNTYSTTCGQYALFFLFCRSHGLSLSKFCSLFTKNYAENDEIVTAFVNGKYNLTTKICDFSLFQ